MVPIRELFRGGVPATVDDHGIARSPRAALSRRRCYARAGLYRGRRLSMEAENLQQESDDQIPCPADILHLPPHLAHVPAREALMGGQDAVQELHLFATLVRSATRHTLPSATSTSATFHRTYPPSLILTTL